MADHSSDIIDLTNEMEDDSLSNNSDINLDDDGDLSSIASEDDDLFVGISLSGLKFAFMGKWLNVTREQARTLCKAQLGSI